MTQNEVSIIENAVLDCTEAYVDARLSALDYVKTQIGVVQGYEVGAGNKYYHTVKCDNGRVTYTKVLSVGNIPFPANSVVFLIAPNAQFSNQFILGKLDDTPCSIRGGSININDKFIVSPSGEMWAYSGNFYGAITGGSININDRFVVDSNGNMTANSGYIGGWSINSNGLGASVSGGASMLTPTQIGVTAVNQRWALATFKTNLPYSYTFLDYGGESSDGGNTWGGFYVAAQGNNNYVLPSLPHTRMSATQFTAYASANRYAIISSTSFDFNETAVGARFYSGLSSGDANIAIEGTYSSRLICYATGMSWSYSNAGSGQWSDIRLKEDINDLSVEKTRAFFKNIRPVEYKYIADNRHKQQYGLIAQELEQALEDSNIINDMIVIEDTTENHYKQIYADHYNAFTLKAIQDLYELVNDLKAEINRLKEDE